METTMVMCNVYSLFREGNRYTQQGKKLVRARVVIPRAYVEEKNANWATNGLMHEILEEETVKYYEYGAILKKKKEASDKVSNQLRDTLTDVIKKGNESIFVEEKEEEGKSINFEINEIEAVEEKKEVIKKPVKKVVKKTTKRRTK